ncbi:MAG TPA: DUF5615 family PIN-like protein [Blastocatellia bacterium]|nr:DUF5615 family PIN-like protein [Blastocatellia bacterium]
MISQFHLDEHIAPAIASALRRRGIDVTTAYEANLLGSTDEAHLQFAHQSGRVIVTHDEDYLRLHAGGRSHAGIAFCRQGKRSIGEMLETLFLIYDVMSSDEMENKVVYL